MRKWENTQTAVLDSWAERLYHQSVKCKGCGRPIEIGKASGLCFGCEEYQREREAMGNPTGYADATEFEHACQPAGYRG
jgi:hypothetical protein